MATQNLEKSLDPIAQHSKLVWLKFSDFVRNLFNLYQLYLRRL